MLPGPVQVDERRRILPRSTGQLEWSRQVEIEEGASGPGVSAGHQVIEAVAVEPDQEALGGRLAAPVVPVVPPANHRGDVQIVRQHQQLDVSGGPADVQVTRPPPVRRHVDKPQHVHLFAVVGETVDGEPPTPFEVFRPPLQLERVLAQGELQGDRAGKDEVIVPKGHLAGPVRPPLGVSQVHATGDRLLGLAVDHSQLQLSARRPDGLEGRLD